jgi:hypothetical protein
MAVASVAGRRSRTATAAGDRMDAKSATWPTDVPTVGTPHAAASSTASGPASCHEVSTWSAAPFSTGDNCS